MPDTEHVTADDITLPDFPSGAIENGRIHAERLESTGLSCEAGDLRMCDDWIEFLRCFEHLASYAAVLADRATRSPAVTVRDDMEAETRLIPASNLIDLLPGTYYMDLPDGGDATVLEQLKRMAEDAAEWRDHVGKLGAPGAAEAVPALVDLLMDVEEADEIERAAELLETYVQFIQNHVMETEIDQNPYLPEIERAARELRAMVARIGEFRPTSDYELGHADALEWAARLAEANDPHTGDWLHDDRSDLANALRKGSPDMPAAPAVPPGYALVPLELTEEMHAAAVRTITRCTGNADFPPRVWRAMLAAVTPHDTSPAPAAEPDMRAICEALGFDPTNHHNAARCPYCRPTEQSQDVEGAARRLKPPHWGAIHTEQSGKVELLPAEFRAYLDRAFLRGAAEALGESKGGAHA